MRNTLFTFLWASAVMVPLFSYAQFGGGAGGFNDKQPIEITADQLEVVQANRQAVFRGNVIAQQGTVSIRANTMVVWYRTGGEKQGEQGAVSRIELKDNVSLVTAQESARAAQGMYNVDTKQVQLVGNVVLTRGQNILKGDRLDFNLQTQKSLLSSNAAQGVSGSGGRVKGVFLPNQ
jgi:lipopolysaccharide export system protein LptA